MISKKINTIWKGITITKQAKKYIQKILKKKKNNFGIIIKIKQSGCAGFKYSLSFIEKEQLLKVSKFYIYQYKNITIYISHKDMYLIDETEIDVIKKNNININITFNNPKINTFCGCGESFHINKKK